MKRTMKSYRMREDTLKELKEIKAYYDKNEADLEATETDIIGWAIAAMHYKLTQEGLISEG